MTFNKKEKKKIWKDYKPKSEGRGRKWKESLRKKRIEKGRFEILF